MWNGFIWISVWISKSREPADSIKMLQVFERLRRIVFCGVSDCVDTVRFNFYIASQIYWSTR